MLNLRVALPRLSIAMIVRNAAEELRQTLASIRNFAGEIVIVDTGSTDDTLSVAEQFGAAVHRHSWDDDFSAARNACLAHARGEWVLWLDAGELLPEDSAAALLEAFDQLDATRACLLPVELPAAPGQVGGERAFGMRLHPRHPALRFCGRVRETLDASLLAAGLSIGELPIPIHRTPRDHDPQVRATRAQRNVRLADQAIAEAGPSAEMHNCLGDAFLALGDPRRSTDHYLRALKLAPPRTRQALDAYYGLLACLFAADADPQAQVAWSLEALESFPLDAQLLVALGGNLLALGHASLAARAYDVAFRHGQVEARLWHVAGIRAIAAACAANAFEQFGDTAQARLVLEAANRMFPESRRVAAQLGRIDAGAQSAKPSFFTTKPGNWAAAGRFINPEN